MTRYLPITVALAATLLTTTAASAPRRQDDLLDRAVAAWTKVKTARATFEQTITNALTGRTLTSSGEYQQLRPGKLAVTFAAPANDRIVADGKYVWMYLPSSAPDQVIKSAQSSVGTGTVDLSAQFLTSPRTKYTVSAAGTLVVSGHATHSYNLIPKSESSAPFKSAVVWIDDADATIRQFMVVDASGMERKVHLTSFKTNVPVDDAAFKFTVQPGMRVIER
ncbi:MAG: outer membrane lipoprotein carrier protein LolA [Gemmatimonadota bacterium]